jgi:hypothetical protein
VKIKKRCMLHYRSSSEELKHVGYGSQPRLIPMYGQADAHDRNSNITSTKTIMVENEKHVIIPQIETNADARLATLKLGGDELSVKVIKWVASYLSGGNSETKRNITRACRREKSRGGPSYENAAENQ